MENEKFMRVRYLRALEHFSMDISKAIKKDDFDELKFNALIEKNMKILNKIPSVSLHSSYSKALLAFVNMAGVSSRAELLKAANALDKFKKAKNYKRDKKLTNQKGHL